MEHRSQRGHSVVGSKTSGLEVMAAFHAPVDDRGEAAGWRVSHLPFESGNKVIAVLVDVAALVTDDVGAIVYRFVGGVDGAVGADPGRYFAALAGLDPGHSRPVRSATFSVVTQWNPGHTQVWHGSGSRKLPPPTRAPCSVWSWPHRQRGGRRFGTATLIAGPRPNWVLTE